METYDKFIFTFYFIWLMFYVLYSFYRTNHYSKRLSNATSNAEFFAIKFRNYEDSFYANIFTSFVMGYTFTYNIHRTDVGYLDTAFKMAAILFLGFLILNEVKLIPHNYNMYRGSKQVDFFNSIVQELNEEVKTNGDSDKAKSLVKLAIEEIDKLEKRS